MSRRESQNTLGLFALLCFCSTLSLSVLRLLLCYLLTICLFVCLLVLAILPARNRWYTQKGFMEGDLIKGLFPMVGLQS